MDQRGGEKSGLEREKKSGIDGWEKGGLERGWEKIGTGSGRE